MNPYSSMDLIFPATMWIPGAGDMYIVLTAIASYLERHESSTPEFEYLNTCDLYSTGNPNAAAMNLFIRAYTNIIVALDGKGVIDARVKTREHCYILELLCNHSHTTTYYHFHL